MKYWPDIGDDDIADVFVIKKNMEPDSGKTGQSRVDLSDGGEIFPGRQKRMGGFIDRHARRQRMRALIVTIQIGLSRQALNRIHIGT